MMATLTTVSQGFASDWRNPSDLLVTSPERTGAAPAPVKTEDAPEWLAYSKSVRTVYGNNGDVSGPRSANTRVTRSQPFHPSSISSRSDLLRVAAQSFAQILSVADRQPPSNAAVRTALTVISALAFTNAPTPQLAYKETAGLEVAWLVGDRSIVASCYSDGGLFIWATDEDESDLFEQEYSDGSRFGGEALTKAVELLKEMGLEITRRVPSSAA